MRGLLRTVLLLLIYAASVVNSQAQLDRTFSTTGFSGVFFLSANYEVFEDRYSSEFALNRGYITFKRRLSENIGVRFTQDVSIDRSGDGEGDIELRLKYAYVNYDFDGPDWLSGSNIEIGVVHRPWLHFEQSVNDFRSQESMFLDRTDLLSSADYGVTFVAGLGESLSEEKQEGLKTPPGKYGSIEVGVYNGGGYAALENNNNKLIESRVSLRPLFNRLPGLQLSALGVIGKGNKAFSPIYEMVSGALTYESEWFNTVVQYNTGSGDSAGDYVNPGTQKSYKLEGWSFFADIRPFPIPVSLSARREMLRNESLNVYAHQYTSGAVAYIFPNRSKIVLSVFRVTFGPTMSDADRTGVTGILEIQF